MKRIVFFDLDNTLIKGQSQQFLMKYLFKKRKVSFLFLVKIYILFFLWKISLLKDVIPIRKKVYRAFKDWDVNATKALISDFFESELKCLFYPEAMEILRQHMKNGDEVVLISGTINLLAEVIKNHIGIEYYISTVLEEKNGRLTGEVSNLILYGENKVKVVKEFLEKHGFSLENSYAYTDHISDLSFLKLVTYPNVVNPDKLLKRVAAINSWPILIFN